MSRQYPEIRGQRKQFPVDALAQEFKIPGHQIGPADAVLKQYIAGNHKFTGIAYQADTAVGMAGRICHS